MDNMLLLKLLDTAKAAAQNAYAPYSGFKVGAALLAKNGQVFLGCNVENASYSLTICAERTALFKAISEGERDFEAIAIWVDADQAFPPCGACRQALYEFGPKMQVIFGNKDGYSVQELEHLLPAAFNIES